MASQTISRCLQCNAKRLVLPTSPLYSGMSHRTINKYIHNFQGVLYGRDLLQCRAYSQGAHSGRHVPPASMAAWQIPHYGGFQELFLNHTTPVPVIQSPWDVLVKVHAASVNPIDTMMIGGYGARTLNVVRQVSCRLPEGSEFPLTLGRDFSGVVVATGKAVTTFKPGDQVWGAGDASKQGTHAAYTLVHSAEISRKPETLNHIEAASLPYVAATTWSALCTVGRLNANNTRDKRILILGGSGGIGTFSIQLMKAWGGHVTTTCATDALEKVLELGADVALDYTAYDVRHELQLIERFDVVYDTLGVDYGLDLLKADFESKYVTIVVPFLRNNDDLGLPFGLAKSALSLGANVLKGLQGGQGYRWALFMPNGRAMGDVASLVDSGKIQPVIDRVYPFDEVPDAFTKVGAKHNRGKTVIDVIGAPEADDTCTEAPSAGS